MVIRDCQFSPNYITSFSILFSIFSGIFLYYSYSNLMLVFGIFFLNISLILDTLDGQYSRLTRQQSEFGGWYDGVSDCIKYIFLFLGLSLGIYYHPYQGSQLFPNLLAPIERNPELVLIMGMAIISNLFMIYYVHATRYGLSFNPGAVAKVEGKTQNYHFGIESTLYTLFTVFLVLKQGYWLLVFLTFTLPLLWIYPIFLVYKQHKSHL